MSIPLIFPVTFSSCLTKSTSPINSPLESFTLTPRLSNFFCTPASAIFENACFKSLPACPDFIAWSPIKPIAADVVDKSIFKLLADEDTYLNASPSIWILVLLLDIVLAKISEACPTSSIPILKAVMLSDIISDIIIKSSPDAVAKSKIGGIAEIISFGLNPAKANFSIPAAASSDVNIVVFPTSIAFFFKASYSCIVAPVKALTLIICLSNSKYSLADEVPIPIAAPTVATAATFIPVFTLSFAPFKKP